MIDLHFVIPGLAVGARFPMAAAARLAAEHGIGRVIDLRLEDRDDEAVLRVAGIRLLHLPTQDACAISQDMIRDGVGFASEGLDRGERVLVHCQYGIGRSALLALCVLVSRGEGPRRALELLKRARPVVSPSPDQLAALLRWTDAVRAERGQAVPHATVEELGAIAWRHLREEDEALSPEAARAGSTRAR